MIGVVGVVAGFVVSMGHKQAFACVCRGPLETWQLELIEAPDGFDRSLFDGEATLRHYGPGRGHGIMGEKFTISMVPR
jgi:hypothetical protein